MIKRLLAILFVAVLGVGLSCGFVQVAFARSPTENVVRAAHQPRACNTYEFFTGVLTNQYNEQLADARKNDYGGRYEIWTNPTNGSWTVLEVMPGNIRTCIVGTGIAPGHTPDELMQRNAFSA